MSEEALFHEALGRSNAEERAAFLDQACAGQPELRAAVEALLAAHEASGPFLDSPADAGATIDSDAGRPWEEATGMHTPGPDGGPAPASITAEYRADAAEGVLIAGRYTLQERIGEGGMGEVWVAKQSEPVKRKVALKLIKPGMDSRSVLQRFEQERQALAMMDHPNIAKVLDAGMTPNGQPFFAMDLVNGLPLNKFCDESRLTPRERLELFVPICQAVQHAHQKGIVHRDLKPANILVTMIDGKPVPKVIDFGVAKATAGKLTDESLSTQFGAVVGTLEYMSPEQAGFSGEDIDTRADIYSLGVILYELLTGLRPIDAKRLKQAALTEMIRIIREEEPSKPSTRLSTDEALPSLAALRQTDPRRLMTILRGELDWVVMKCLEKPRERRYETANALARDIERYLADEAVEARPPSSGYRLRKFVRRNRGQVVAAGLLLLALVGGIIGTSYGLYRANRAAKAERLAKVSAEDRRREAEKQRARAEDRELQAIDAVKRFRDAVSTNPELKNNPGLDALRKTLLKEPLAFFKDLRERLQVDRDTRPESLRRLAKATHEHAHLIREIGDRGDALRAHAEGLALWEQLVRDAPADPDSRSGLANILKCQAHSQLQTGRFDEALASCARSLEILERLGVEDPSSTTFAREQAAIHNDLGNLRIATGRPDDGMASYRRAIEIQERLTRETPANARFAGDLAQSCGNLAIQLASTGRTEEALAFYRRAIEIQERLIREDPTSTSFARDLARNYRNLGTAQGAARRTDDAVASFRHALAIDERLARENPTDIGFARGLALSHINFGIVQWGMGRPDDALASFNPAVAILERLARENPADVGLARELAVALRNVGNLHREERRPDEAKTLFARAAATQERLAREHPESPEVANDLGLTLESIARVDLAAGRYDEARGRLLEAVRRQRQALAADPRNTEYRNGLVSHLSSLNHACVALKDAEGAAAARKEIAEVRAGAPRP